MEPMKSSREKGRGALSGFRREVFFVLAGYLLLVVCLYRLRIPCVFLSLTGYPCPGCGMTRAWICALHLDFPGALRNHAMFWSVPVVVVLFLLPARLLDSRPVRLLLFLLAAGFLGNWIFRLCSG